MPKIDEKIKEIIETILISSGVKTDKEREKFLNPKYERDIYDSKLLPDFEKASERIFQAITTGEKIAIYSDYDCDGIPSATIMHEFLTQLGVRHLEIYIPDRNTLGYGLHKNILENIINSEVKLLLTLDLGTTAKEAIDFAESSGVNVIVIDHHEPTEILPKPFALINPKIKNSKYPFRELCATGVVYKFILGFLEKYGEYFKYKKGKEKWFLDLVALATIADQVPLVDENRILAKYGLLVFRKGKRLGLNALCFRSKVNILKINEEDINFSIAPKINAASRMDEAYKAFSLLSSKDRNTADILAEDLARLSDKRKIIVAQMMREAKKNIKQREFKNIICVGSPDWIPGLLGILASKISEEYKKTVFVWGKISGGEDIIKGSCRAFGNANVMAIMKGAKEFFLEIGGHEKAGGFSTDKEKVHFLQEKLDSSFEDSLKNIKNIKNDAVQALELSLEYLDNDFLNNLKELSPFGSGNQKPIFIFKDMYIEDIQKFGKEKNHLRFVLSKDGKKIEAISFFKKLEDFKEKVELNSLFNVLGFLEKDEYRFVSRPRIRILDIEK